MAANEYEPSAESVEAEAREVSARYKAAVGFGVEYASAHANWQDFCRHEARTVLRRQHEREDAILAPVKKYALGSGISVDALRLANDVCNARLALDAPKPLTLLEAAKALLGDKFGTLDAYNALKAAVEREENK